MAPRATASVFIDLVRSYDSGEYAAVVSRLEEVVPSFPKRVVAIVKARLVSVSGILLFTESLRGMPEIFARRVWTSFCLLSKLIR